jgi:glycerol uptake facilitator-like aquaporin
LFTTSVLVCAVLGTAVRHRVVGPNAAIAAGAAVALGGIVGRSVSGASMNPARSIASALVSGRVSTLWIYILAPLTGAVLGNALMALIHTRRHREERAAAEGEK